MSFSQKLKELRTQKNLSQSDLAKAIFVSRSAVAKWENGLGIPNDSNLQVLSEYFGVSEETLLDRQDLKEYVKMSKPKVKNCIVATVGIALPVLLLILSFAITFDQPLAISMYYPPMNIWQLCGFMMMPVSKFWDHVFSPWTSFLILARTLLGFALAVGVFCFALSVLSFFVPWFKKHDKAILWTIIFLCVAVLCLSFAAFCAAVYKYFPGNFQDFYDFLYHIFG